AVLHVESLAGDAHRVVNFRQMVLGKLDVQHGSDHLDHFPESLFVASHNWLLDKDENLCRERCAAGYPAEAAPLTISIISLVMAAWRTLFMYSVSLSINS